MENIHVRNLNFSVCFWCDFCCFENVFICVLDYVFHYILRNFYFFFSLDILILDRLWTTVFDLEVVQCSSVVEEPPNFIFFFRLLNSNVFYQDSCDDEVRIVDYLISVLYYDEVYYFNLCSVINSYNWDSYSGSRFPRYIYDLLRYHSSCMFIEDVDSLFFPYVEVVEVFVSHHHISDGCPVEYSNV